MSKIVESLRSLDEEMQISLLEDYFSDAKHDGNWHEAHAIEERLNELKSNNAEVVEKLEAEKTASAQDEKARLEEQYKNSFVARGID